MKRLFALLLTLSLLLCVPLTAQAHQVPQERDDCSIEVIVRYDGENIDGGTLTAVKVGYVSEDDGNYFFCQEKTGLRLDDISFSNAPGIQLDFYNASKDAYDFVTLTRDVKDGKAVFDGLSTGLYLIIQDSAAAGYSKMAPFLVSVPCMEDGEYVYHITAAIKSELEREPEKEPTTPPPTKPTDSDLPQSGQLNWPVPLMVAAGLALFTAGLALRAKDKKEQYEK